MPVFSTRNFFRREKVELLNLSILEATNGTDFQEALQKWCLDNCLMPNAS